MKRAFSYWWLGLLIVLLFAVGMYSQNGRKKDSPFPRAQFDDKMPLGGKGLRLLLEKQGFKTRLQSESLQSMPVEARVWLLFDPETTFSSDEAKVLLQWVEKGGVLIWSNWQLRQGNWWEEESQGGQGDLRKELGITPTQVSSQFIDLDKSLYPIMEQIPPLPGDYGQAVREAYLSPNTFNIIPKKKARAKHHMLVGKKDQMQLAEIRRGKGRILLTADAMMFTNYGLSRGDTAVLATNLIRQGIPPKAVIYFDERQQKGAIIQKLPHTLLYYLWRPPLRWALFQLIFAGLLLWAFYGRRLGKPVPIPARQSVTRASQFAVAMAGLYQKARRPKVPLEVLGQEFRRFLCKRTGASLHDNNVALANRCGAHGGVDPKGVLHVLDQLQKLVRSDADALQLAQKMDEIREQLQ